MHRVGRGSQEGDTAAAVGGDVGEDHEVWSDGFQYFDEEQDRSEDEDADYADSDDSTNFSRREASL